MNDFFLFFSILSVSVLTFKTPYSHTPSSLQFFAPRLKRTKTVSDGGLTFFPLTLSKTYLSNGRTACHFLYVYFELLVRH